MDFTRHPKAERESTFSVGKKGSLAQPSIGYELKPQMVAVQSLRLHKSPCRSRKLPSNRSSEHMYFSKRATSVNCHLTCQIEFMDVFHDSHVLTKKKINNISSDEPFS